MVSPGACHAPHQAPKDLIDKYDQRFTKGWDATRRHRLDRQLELGVVPPKTGLPARNDRVEAWDNHTDDERRLFTRLQAAYAAMLEHTDTHLGRLVEHLDTSGQLDNTIVLVLSDNGASQEGGPLGFVNAMSVYNMVPEPMDEKVARIDDIGGPDTHSNFPLGWAMTANTPLKRYKQNTHGGGVRDPLVIHAPGMVDDPGGLRQQFCHVADLAPTVLDLLGIGKAAEPAMTGVSFAATVGDPEAEPAKTTQYFEMFGHRGIWHDGWKAVAFHQPGTPWEDDQWELYHLDADFSELHNRADSEPERLQALKERWWAEAEANKVLPLDDRFGERFAENAVRHTGRRRTYTFWAGMGHLPSDVAPDLRSRSYTITAEVDIPSGGADGVLIAHGDATCGYSLFVQDGYLVHDLNIGGNHQMVRSDRPVPTGGPCTLAFQMARSPGEGPFPHGTGTLLIDGEPTGILETDRIFWLMISWSGLDVGFDRGTTVSDYDRTGRHIGPFAFTGTLHKVTVDLENDQDVDSDASADLQVSRD